MSRRRARFFGRDTVPRRSDRPIADASSVPSFSAERAVVSPPPIVPVLTIDALGRKCPIPIIMLAEQIRDVPLGSVVAVLADDPAAYTDVPSWCMMKAHEFVASQELPRGWALFIRRMVLAMRAGRPARSAGHLTRSVNPISRIKFQPEWDFGGRLVPGGIKGYKNGAFSSVKPGSFVIFGFRWA
jgi:tRNA 2-thiouridine synthesizing protein A